MFNLQQFDAALPLRQVALLSGASEFLNSLYCFRYHTPSHIREIDCGISGHFNTGKRYLARTRLYVEDGFIFFSCSCSDRGTNLTADCAFENIREPKNREDRSTFCEHFVPLVLAWYKLHPEAAQYPLLEPVLKRGAVVSIDQCKAVLKAVYGSAGLLPEFLSELVNMSNYTELEGMGDLRKALKHVATLKNSHRTDFAVIAAAAEMGLYRLDRTFSSNVDEDHCNVCDEAVDLLHELLVSASKAGSVPGPELARMLVMGLVYASDGKWHDRIQLRNLYAEALGDAGLVAYDKLSLKMLAVLGNPFKFI